LKNGILNVFYSDVGSGDFDGFDTFDNSMSSDLLLYEFPESCIVTLPRTDVDYHLISRSSCIDTGQDRSADGFTDDIEGGVRVTDGEEAEEMAVTGIWALTNMVLPRQGGYRKPCIYF